MVTCLGVDHVSVGQHPEAHPPKAKKRVSQINRFWLGLKQFEHRRESTGHQTDLESYQISRYLKVLSALGLVEESSREFDCDDFALFWLNAGLRNHFSFPTPSRAWLRFSREVARKQFLSQNTRCPMPEVHIIKFNRVLLRMQ
jgi:hypothetical protein